ncbi:hypothetical protein N7478_012693 [Penicillium angulare]|uniref:uncharacterized protein n=1 Tax=Penicillium angulare TaxID=116970 RepID=UPI00253FC83C|nr:uncharacterized protein N7478_012693 [Penicillium angulare]KAJ5256589.1 hypothetical protein N7478_012693 [Penicillium angulare]
MMSFQDFLPSDTPKYRYKSYDECLQLFEEKYDELKCEEDPLGQAYNPYFIMDVDECSFLDCFVYSGERLLTLSWEIYDHVSQSTLLRMESSQHAVAIGAFTTIFSAWARTVPPEVENTSTRTVRGATRTKRADISWAPKNMPRGLSHKWPTFVGEVAWSEPRSKLIADMKFWLNDPGSCVNAAITISVLRGRILIEKWETSGNQTPSPSQALEICRNPKHGFPQVSGNLSINFADVFLRNPDPEKGEEDFILTETDMHEMADQVWSFQYDS